MKIFFLFLILGAAISNAAYLGAISSATAGSGRGAVEVSDSAFLNPATLAYLRGYYFTSSYSTSRANVSSTSEAITSDLAIGLTDNMKETIVPTSLWYIQSSKKIGDSDVISKDLRVALGEKVNSFFSVGLSGHYKNDKRDAESYGQTNLTVATAAALTDNLSLGVVFDDFMAVPNSIPEEFRLQPLASAGVSYNYKKVIRGKLDLVSGSNYSTSRLSVLGGFETFLNKWIILRMGLGHSFETKSELYSAGMGFKGPKFGVHYAFQRGFEDDETRHSIDLAVPIW